MKLSLNNTSRLALTLFALLIGLVGMTSVAEAQTTCTEQCVGGNEYETVFSHTAWIEGPEVIVFDELQGLNEPTYNCSPRRYENGEVSLSYCTFYEEEATWNDCLSTEEVCTTACSYSGTYSWGDGCSATTDITFEDGQGGSFGNQVPGYEGTTSWTCDNGELINTGESCEPPAGCSYNDTYSWGDGCSASANVSFEHGQSDTFENTAPGYNGNTRWECNDGTFEPISESCSAIGEADPEPVQVACGDTVNRCKGIGSGTRTTVNDLDDTDEYHLWQCVGTNGGATANINCQLSKSLTDDSDTDTDSGSDSTIAHGECGDSRNSCITGKFHFRADTGTHNRWYCVGQGVEETTASCSVLKKNPTPDDGSQGGACPTHTSMYSWGACSAGGGGGYGVYDDGEVVTFRNSEDGYEGSIEWECRDERFYKLSDTCSPVDTNSDNEESTDSTTPPIMSLTVDGEAQTAYIDQGDNVNVSWGVRSSRSLVCEVSADGGIVSNFTISSTFTSHDNNTVVSNISDDLAFDLTCVDVNDGERFNEVVEVRVGQGQSESGGSSGSQDETPSESESESTSQPTVDININGHEDDVYNVRQGDNVNLRWVVQADDYDLVCHVRGNNGLSKSFELSSGGGAHDTMSIENVTINLRFGLLCTEDNTGETYSDTVEVSPSQTPPAISGRCGAEVDTCERGTYRTQADTSTQYRWYCDGENNGINANCKLDKPQTSESTSGPDLFSYTGLSCDRNQDDLYRDGELIEVCPKAPNGGISCSTSRNQCASEGHVWINGQEVKWEGNTSGYCYASSACEAGYRCSNNECVPSGN